jgi:hypothetical protein
MNTVVQITNHGANTHNNALNTAVMKIMRNSGANILKDAKNTVVPTTQYIAPRTANVLTPPMSAVMVILLIASGLKLVKNTVVNLPNTNTRDGVILPTNVETNVTAVLKDTQHVNVKVEPTTLILVATQMMEKNAVRDTGVLLPINVLKMNSNAVKRLDTFMLDLKALMTTMNLNTVVPKIVLTTH